jgi:hypothetical protein
MLFVIKPNGKDSRTLYEELCMVTSGDISVTDFESEIFVSLPADATYDLDTVISICEKYGETAGDDA